MSLYQMIVDGELPAHEFKHNTILFCADVLTGAEAIAELNYYIIDNGGFELTPSEIGELQSIKIKFSTYNMPDPDDLFQKTLLPHTIEACAMAVAQGRMTEQKFKIAS